MCYSQQNNFQQPLHSKVNQAGAGSSLLHCFFLLTSLELLLIYTDIYMRTEGTNGILINSSMSSMSQNYRTQPYKRYKAIWRCRFKTRLMTQLINLMESGSRTKNVSLSVSRARTWSLCMFLKRPSSVLVINIYSI